LRCSPRAPSYVSPDEPDLEDAISDGKAMLKSEALAADNIPEDELRNGLSDALANRYRMNHNIENLELAINHCEHTIKISPGSSILAGNLASHSALRFAQKGDLENLKKTIDYLQTAVHNSHLGLHRIPSLINLGFCMHDQFVRDGDHAILDQSVDTLREAERITPGATWGESFAQPAGELSRHSISDGLREGSEVNFSSPP
jgi:hypothetical protein